MPPAPGLPDVVKRSCSPGESPYERVPYVSVRAGTNEAVLTQNGLDLEASSGICLLIPVYAPKSKMGAIIHLAREEKLWDSERDLIRKSFIEHPRLGDVLEMAFVSSAEIARRFPEQLAAAEELIRSLPALRRGRARRAAERPGSTPRPEVPKAGFPGNLS